MKKEMKILVGFIICIALFGAIWLFNAFVKMGKTYPQYIYQNAYEYLDSNPSDVQPIQLGSVAESEGYLYYINADNQLLYKNNNPEENTEVSNMQMDQMAIVNDYIVFRQGEELMVQNILTGGIINISSLSKYSISSITCLKDSVLFINDKDQLCSYDFVQEKMKILSQNTSDFIVSGGFIFYECRKFDFFGTGRYDGLYAMDMDGDNKKQITDIRGIYDFEIYEDMLFVSTDRFIICKINMHDSSYSVFEGSIFSDFQIANDHLYYVTSEDPDGDRLYEHVFIENDLNGNITQRLHKNGFKDECWVESNGTYLFQIFAENEADSTVRIHDKTGRLIDEIIYEDSRIEEFVCLPDYIVVRLTRDDETVSYVYDGAFQELGSF